MKTIIKNGTIVDPSQDICGAGDLILKDGAVEGIDLTGSASAADADQVIDAQGLIVSPGFIDIHMHEDELDPATDRAEKSMSHSALRMGVTTDIGGNCGLNTADPDHFLDVADRDGAPVNIGMLAGHAWLRNRHGEKDRYKGVSEDDVKQMVRDCEKFLDSGCLGISAGLEYVPGCTLKEIEPLASLCRAGDKVLAGHVRADMEDVYPAAEELAQIGRDCGIRIQFSHIGSMGGFGQMPHLLEMIEGYRKEGIDMMADCYPYQAFCTHIGSTTYDPGFLERYDADYDSVLIASGKYAGQRCTKEIFDEVREKDPMAAAVGFFIKAEDVDLALQSPLVMLGSDGIRDKGKGHPRASGAFARFISDYIRTGKVSLSDGISKMTTMAAERLHLPKKGSFRSGCDGDVTIFNLSRVEDRATYNDSEIPPVGFEYVLIGGQIALAHDQIVNDGLGRSIRR